MTNINLYNDDCMNVFLNLKDNSVDLTLTDIPYDEVNRKGNGLRNLDKSHADVITFTLNDFIDESVRVTKGSIYIFCGSVQVSQVRERLLNHGLSVRHCIWEKTNPSPMNGQHIWLSSIENCVFAKKSGAVFNEHCKSSVWRNPIERCEGHPTPKPVKLMARLIEASSNVGGIVFDPCMGSGSVGVAAKQIGRDFIGVEMNTDYFNLAKRRIEETSESILSFL